MPTVVAKIPAAAAVLAVFSLGFRILKRVLGLYLKKVGTPDPIRELLTALLKYAVVLLAMVTAAAQLGIDVTSLVAGLGIAGLAISLAAQDTITNIICGVTLAIDKPFTAGDWIEIDGLNARVTDVHLRTTTLTTFDNQTIVLPNRSIVQQRIINYTLVPRIRARVAIGCPA